MLTREWLSQSLSMAQISPPMFWGTLPAKRDCLFYATPLEMPGSPNRWTWILTHRLLAERLERAFGVEVGERVHQRALSELTPAHQYGAVAARVLGWEWARAYRVPIPTHAIYSRYHEQEACTLEAGSDAITFLDYNGDTIADYVALDLSCLDQWLSLQELPAPQQVRVVVPDSDEHYNPVPVVGEWPYRPNMRVVLPAPLVVSTNAYRGQREPIDPQQHGSDLAVVAIWYDIAPAFIVQSLGIAAFQSGLPCSDLFLRTGLQFPEISKGVSAEYPAEYCNPCLRGLFDELRQDLMMTKISMYPTYTLLGTKRGLIEMCAAFCQRQYLL